MVDSQRFYLRTAGILGALAVVFAALGAHASKSLLETELAGAYETAVRYHVYHTLAILAVAGFAGRSSSTTWWRWACRAWLAGILLFSGSLYALLLADVEWLGAVTPVGGVAFIIGWLCLVPAAGDFVGQGAE